MKQACENGEGNVEEMSSRIKKASSNDEALKVVGEEGFEPPTLWSQTRCATKLRYSPTKFCFELNQNRKHQGYQNNGVANET